MLDILPLPGQDLTYYCRGMGVGTLIERTFRFAHIALPHHRETHWVPIDTLVPLHQFANRRALTRAVAELRNAQTRRPSQSWTRIAYESLAHNLRSDSLLELVAAYTLLTTCLPEPEATATHASLTHQVTRLLNETFVHMVGKVPRAALPATFVHQFKEANAPRL
jgi:hypothetical protein